MDDRTWTDSELEELASQHGYTVSARQLERWHKADVLPRPIQDAHAPKGTRSFYPPGTDASLLAACRLKAEGKGRPLWRLRFELWWEGFAIPSDKVRASLAALLSPVNAKLDNEVEREGALEGLEHLEDEQTRRGLAAHVRQALRGRPYEAIDLMTLILDLLAGQKREINAPIDRAVSNRTFADALADVLAFDGTRGTTASGLENVIRSGGIAEALREATATASHDPHARLAGISDDRLLAARDAAVALQTALLVTATALRRLKGHDSAGLRLVHQAERETDHPTVRAKLVMLFASTRTFDLTALQQASAMFEATGRRYWAMLRVLEAVPESRILEDRRALEALPTVERDALSERIDAFLAVHPDVADILKDSALEAKRTAPWIGDTTPA